MTFTDVNKTYELALRVYNNKQSDDLRLEDEKAIKALCSSIFPADGTSPSQHELNMFNNIVVKVATTISEADVQQLIRYMADMQTVPYDTQVVRYNKSVPHHIKFKWSAVGSGVSLRKVEPNQDQFIEIGQVQLGITYNPLSNVATQVDDFRALVKDVAAARVRLVYETLVKLITKGVSSGGIIPTKQYKSGANVTIADFDKIAGILGKRTGSRPIFIADRLLINAIAAKKLSTCTGGLPDSLKSNFYDLEVTNLGSADAIPLQNEFTSETGYDTMFPVDTGYVVGSAAGKKPFSVALAGGLTQKTEEDVEYGRIKLVVRQKLGADFLYAGNIGVIQDTAVTI